MSKPSPGLQLRPPAFGQPCNGCGWCCKLSLCEPARVLLGSDANAPCPMLVDDGKRYWCGLVIMEDKHPHARANPLIQIGLGIGKGCQADFRNVILTSILEDQAWLHSTSLSDAD